MACAAKRDTDKPYQIDIKELVEKYIWKRFKEESSFVQKIFHRKSKYYLDIRWGYIDFAHETKYREREINTNRDNVKIELYFSEYENKTAEDQIYKFSTSRTTTATTKIELQQNYTLGAKTNIEVDLGIAKIGGGVDGSMAITETEGQEFSQTLTWNIDTEIKVPSWNHAKATLHVTEMPVVVDFTVTTRMKLKTGSLPVSVRCKQSNRIVKTFWIENLTAIFPKGYQDKYGDIVKEHREKHEGVELLDVQMLLTTYGICRMTSWKNQHVEVVCRPINKDTNVPAKQGNKSHDVEPI